MIWRWLYALRWPLRLVWIAVLPCVAGMLVFLAYSRAAAPLALYALADATHGVFRCGASSGSLRGPLLLQDCVVETPLWRLDIDHAQIVWRWRGLLTRRLAVTELHAGRARLSLKPHPPLPPSAHPFTHLPLPLTVDTLDVQSFELQPVNLDHPLVFTHVQLQADWTGDLIDAHGVEASWAPLGRIHFDGKLRLLPRALAIESSQWSGPADAAIRGQIGYDNNVRLTANWTRLQWPLRGEPLVHSARGQAGIDGHWRDYGFNVQADVDGWQQQGRVVAHGRGTLQGLDVAGAELKALGGNATAHGQLNWHAPFSLSLEGHVAGLDPGLLRKDLPGRISGNTSLDMTRGDDGLRTDFRIALADSTLRGVDFSLDTQGRYAGHALEVVRAELQAGGSHISVHGRATPPFDLEARVDSPDLGDFVPDLVGNLKAQLHLGGMLDDPHVAGRANLLRARYAALALEHAALDLDVSPRAASHIDLAVEDFKAGMAIPKLTVHAEGTAAAHVLQARTETAAGSIDLLVRGAADLNARSWKGEIRDSHGAPLRLSPWTLEEPSQVSVTAQGIKLEPTCWHSGAARACVQYTRSGGGNARLAFRLLDWAFGYFEPFMPPQWTITGKASGTGLLVYENGKLKQARAELQTTAGALNVAGHPAVAFKESALHAADEDQGMHAELSMPLDTGMITLNSTLAPANAEGNRALSGSLLVEIGDLAPLRLLSSEVESVHGRVHGEFKLAGTAAAPLAEGQIALTDGRVRLTAPGVEITGLQASLSGSSASPLIDLRASADSGGGSVTLTGKINPRDKNQRVDLALKGNEFQVINTPQARVWASPDLSFTMGADHADLRGRVSIPRAQIMAKNFSQGIGPTRDQIILGPQDKLPAAEAFKVSSAVRVALGDDVSFEGYGLKATLRGAIDTTDEPNRPTQARGEITLVDGRYKAYGQDLIVENGRLLFEGGLITQPAIEVRAVRNNTSDVTVGVLVRGTLAAPQMTLFSSPEMPPEQQLSWLISGHGAEEPANASERSSLSNAALSLGMSGGSFLTQKLGGTLGFDDVTLGAQAGQSSDQAQFTIGKYLSPKLYISYGVGLFQPGHTFRLLYDISKHFKLSTETGVESGGDVLYTTDR